MYTLMTRMYLSTYVGTLYNGINKCVEQNDLLVRFK
jgi:hypothetical protein